jgi:D-alanyl-D-alanine carboxypeptidase/D-alanyl-D-alanine-endopeptidase (penicillin-binding protein 4)
MTFKTIFIIISILIANSNKNSDLLTVTEEIQNYPALQNGRWSIYAKNLTQDRVILNINSNKCMIPASNLKLFTSAIALDQLGINFTMKTTLGYSGTIDSKGVLNGNIILKGTGDPTLGSPNFDTVPSMDSLFTLFVEAIQAHRIQHIEGDIIADDSYLDYMPLPGGWSWTDIGNYYAPLTSALTIHENLYYLFFRPALYTGGPAEIIRVEPEIPGLSFFNHMRTGPIGSGDNGYIYGAPWQYLHQLEGTVPAGVPEFSIKGSLPDPALFAVQSLKKEIEQTGIKINGDAKTYRTSPPPNMNIRNILTIESPPLRDIVYYLNKTSANLYAEQLLKVVAKEKHLSGDLDTGIELIEEWLEGKNITTDGLYMYDASGLSYLDRVTTYVMVDFLEKLTHEPFF